MFQELEKRITAAVEEYVAVQHGFSTRVALEQPKQSSFGEFAIPVAFQLARQLKKTPKQIAEDLIRGLGAIEGEFVVEIAGNGYINLRLDRRHKLWHCLKREGEDGPAGAEK